MHALVHGGAGSKPDDPETRQTQVDHATESAENADSPVAAVVAAVRELESDPRFNAGVGSAVQSDGTIRTDAGLMTGDSTVGAACSMPGVEHAVEVARVVAEETPHVIVSGEQAVELGAAFGVETDRDLWTPASRERWNELDHPGKNIGNHLAWVREQFGGTDTVGAVATDGTKIAAATSTGGRWCALAGRVGDVPQVGAGFYASRTAAASTTGAGEAIARFGLARRVVEAIDGGDDPQTATDRLIRGFGTETDAHAGVIALDSDGRSGRAHNAEAMQTALSHQ